MHECPVAATLAAPLLRALQTGGSEIWLARGVSGDRRRHVHELWSESQSDDRALRFAREGALRERGRFGLCRKVA